ncbi:hypothetical protein [Rhodococcus sp. X156]|uniref:acetate/propionate family kinase n=1 Tax=Rhodococcus sp. X156 TaxID=2499145 RepID=UPI000FD75DE4|nr:hypothetical protein [Rhodococcus sp. X156]
MTAAVLALNPGSSSLKATVRTDEVVVNAHVQRLGTDRAELWFTDSAGTSEKAPPGRTLTDAVQAVAAELRRRGIDVAAVAHRVVHGGPTLLEPTVITDDVVATLESVTPMAPLHTPGNLESIAAARATWPQLSHVACFDTTFHNTMPDEGKRLPLPDDLVALGIRRYGFHGLSVQNVVDRIPDLGNAVVAHLGSGCSVTAVSQGRSLHNTMSFSPTGGMISATRSGDLDPEVALFLVEQHGWKVPDLRILLDKRCGLAGVSGGTTDMRDLLAQRTENAAADLAVRVFTRSAAQAIASAAAVLPGWDTLVFTGGIGEHSPQVREAICDRLRHLGLPRLLVSTADEEAVMDDMARKVLAGQL